MVDKTDNVYRLFSKYNSQNVDKVIDQVYIGDFETVFMLDDRSKVIFDELSTSMTYISPSTDDKYLSDEKWKKEFIRKLKKKMKLGRITQTSLAEQLDISRISISRYLSGKQVPDYMTLRKMSKIFRCPVSELTDFWYLL